MLDKVTYTDQETVISAKNMNDIQDAILALDDGLFSVDNDKSGEVITITDAAKRGFKSFNIYGKTTQDGTPTPDAPVDLVSVGEVGSISVTVAEKNLWNGKFENIAFGSSEETGSIVTILSYPTYKSIVVPVIPGGKYSFSRGKAIWSGLYIAFTQDYPTIHTTLIFEDGKTTTYLSPYNKDTALEIPGITVPDNCYYMVVYLTNDSDTYEVTNTWYQVEAGGTVTGYEADNGQTLTISTPNGLPGIPVTSGGNYTDSNGQQWVCDEIDLARGVYVQRLTTEVSDGSTDEGWDYNASMVVFRRKFTNMKSAYYQSSLCDKYLHGTTTSGLVSGQYWGRNSYFGDRVIAFKNSNFTDKASWVAHLAENPITVLYELETPIETPLSEEELAAYRSLHTYKDNTTVSNNAIAWMELEYAMDAKKYIDSKISGAILAATVE